jgi:hypothetical protein
MWNNVSGNESKRVSEQKLFLHNEKREFMISCAINIEIKKIVQFLSGEDKVFFLSFHWEYFTSWRVHKGVKSGVGETFKENIINGMA